jgi:hypothetical protein
MEAASRRSAVPPVAWMVKPMRARRRMGSMMVCLSSSRTETKMPPLAGSVGKRDAAAIWLLAKAISKERSIPMTSPVERISGPSTTSTPGNLLKGKTDSLTA